MARPISDEELQLKKRARRRLVGAIVLVTAVAVILPMVLDSEPKPVSQNVDIQIPSPDSGEFKPKAPAIAHTPAESTPIKGMPPASAKSAAPAPQAKSDDAPAKADAPATAIAEPAASTTPAKKEAPKAEVADAKASSAASTSDVGKTAREPAKAAAKESAASNGTFVVQVAALADSARVKQLQKQMTSAGVKTYTEVVTTKAGEVTRVRAGPYATREAAETARSQLKKAGLDGKVVSK
ncbi:MAG TPA: SPOR domain-containing protein [Burkholderiales bacterium]|jgi:DedD protein|nr:SPOR domain-containing protein [Burkholderiales bacterium]